MRMSRVRPITESSAASSRRTYGSCARYGVGAITPLARSSSGSPRYATSGTAVFPGAPSGCARHSSARRGADLGVERRPASTTNGSRTNGRRVESHRLSLSRAPAPAPGRSDGSTGELGRDDDRLRGGRRAACTSNAPMSTTPSTTGANPGPRWSNSLVGKLGTGSGPCRWPGCPASSVWVSVGPPLFWSGPAAGRPRRGCPRRR